LTIAGPAAPASLTTAYGSNLGSTVSVQDSAGVAHPATLLYTSATQINFEIPASVSIGAALVTIGTQTAMVQIAPVAPSLYILNSSGLAAAYVVQVGNGGVQTVESDSTPINVSSGQVYLILYGTGIRGAGSNVTVTIGGVNAPVAYSGPAPSTPGLDQVNVLIPAQLAGSGTVNIVLRAASIAANVVKITLA
jgi:uncharacterized protein (TIGR03437 family)